MRRIRDRIGYSGKTSGAILHVCESCGIAKDCKRCRRASKAIKISQAAQRRPPDWKRKEPNGDLPLPYTVHHP